MRSDLRQANHGMTLPAIDNLVPIQSRRAENRKNSYRNPSSAPTQASIAWFAALT